MRQRSITAVLLALLLSVPAAALAAPRGATPRAAAPNLCVSEGPGNCVTGTGLLGARDSAVTPDGKFVYSISVGDPAGGGSAISVFRRSARSGALTQLADPNDCYSAAAAECQAIVGLGEMRGIAISPDGLHVYVTSDTTDAIAAFARNVTTGALTQLADPNDCISEAGGSCIDGVGLDGALGIDISPDGLHVYVASSASDAVAEFTRNPTTGVLSQLTDPDDCIAETAGDCADGVGLDDARSVAVSPDGNFVYVASAGSDAIAAFSRNTSTGELTQLADPDDCIAETGGDCVDGVGLDGARFVVIDPTGSHLYVASQESDSIAAFSRNIATGALTPLVDPNDCISNSGGDCAQGFNLDLPSTLAMSPNGENIFVAVNNSRSLVVLGRDTTTGALSEVGCIAEVSVPCEPGAALHAAIGVSASPDGKHVYVSALGSDAITAFKVTSTMGRLSGPLTRLADPNDCIAEVGGECADGVGLTNAYYVTTSRDGKNVYATSQNEAVVSAFTRNRTTGALTQLGGLDACIGEASVAECADATAMDGPSSIAVTPDGKSAYVTNPPSNAVVVFNRDVTTGALQQMADPNECLSDGGTNGCVSATGLSFAYSVVVSPDSRFVYVAAFDGFVTSFSRDLTTGALTQLPATSGCFAQTLTPGCGTAIGLDGAFEITMSRDGKNVYVASSGTNVGTPPGNGTIAVFSRDKTTGVLSQLASPDDCIAEAGAPCADGRGMGYLRSIAVSPDGKNVYGAAEGDDAVSVFSRNTTTGALTQLASPMDCVAEDGGSGGCADGWGLDGATSVRVSVDGRYVFVASVASDAVVAFKRRRDGSLQQVYALGGPGLDGARGLGLTKDGRHLYVASVEDNAVSVFKVKVKRKKRRR